MDEVQEHTGPKMDVMELHSTEMTRLTPTAILGAADADIGRRERNIDPSGTEYEHYAFLRSHVRKAKGSARALIEVALAQRDAGLMSGKKNTRIIYRDEPTLRMALEAAVNRG